MQAPVQDGPSRQCSQPAQIQQSDADKHASECDAHTDGPDNRKATATKKRKLGVLESTAGQPVSEACPCTSDAKGVVQHLDQHDRLPLVPVVKKLVKKHGGSMELQKLIQAISSKKKRRFGLTTSNCMHQVSFFCMAYGFISVLYNNNIHFRK